MGIKVPPFEGRRVHIGTQTVFSGRDRISETVLGHPFGSGSKNNVIHVFSLFHQKFYRKSPVEIYSAPSLPTVVLLHQQSEVVKKVR